MTATLAMLEERFAVSGQISFRELGDGFIIIDIHNDHCTASIALQGAHLLSWTPANEQPVIWLSKDARFTEGKAIRGGIPVCWPWFGAHDSEPSFPAHGLARTAPWEVVGTERLDDGGSRISFCLDMDGSNPMWPYPTACELCVTLGNTLEMALTTTNQGAGAIVVGQALHSYFAVGDIGKATVHGLDGRPYLDKLDGFKRQIQEGSISFDAETDRVYLQTAGECRIEDRELNRTIHIEKSGSASTVVWNPGRERAAAMGDLGEDGYRTMLCVESANAADDVVRIAPGCSTSLSVCYRVKHGTKDFS